MSTSGVPSFDLMLEYTFYNRPCLATGTGYMTTLYSCFLMVIKVLIRIETFSPYNLHMEYTQ